MVSSMLAIHVFLKHRKGLGAAYNKYSILLVAPVYEAWQSMTRQT